MTGEEEVVVVDTEVIDGVGGGAGVRTRRRLSTSSWKGSGWLMLNHSVGVGPIFCYGSRRNTEVCKTGRWYLLIQQSYGSRWR